MGATKGAKTCEKVQKPIWARLNPNPQKNSLSRGQSPKGSCPIVKGKCDLEYWKPLYKTLTLWWTQSWG